MKTYILTSMAKVFLDEEPSDNIKISSMTALKGEKAGFQFCFSAEDFLSDIHLEVPKYLRAYIVRSAPVVKAVDSSIDDYYLRTGPGLYPDILKPYNGENIYLPKNVWMSFYLELDNMPSGINEIPLVIKNADGEVIAEKNFTVEVLNTSLPEQTLICTNWFHCDALAEYYKVPVFSEEFWRIAENFIKTAVEHGINFILTPLFTPPLDTRVGYERLTVQLVGVTVTDRGYEFDFTKLKKWIDMCKRCGIKYYEMSHLFTQWGALHAPKIKGTVNGEEKTIFGWDTDSSGEEYTSFLRALAPALTEFLEKEGVADYTYFHVSDEPGENDLEVYGKLSALIHEIFGKRFKIFDALSEFKYYEQGYVTTPVPSEASIEDFAGKVPELWTYYCCGPTNNYYSNRFLAMPLQRTRIIGMQLYKYDVKGFLHWGYNYYFTRLSVRPVNPFAETDSGCGFSAGDAFVVYPGDDGTAWPSIRLKAMDAGFRDMRALQLLETKIGREETVKLIEDNGGKHYDLSFTNYPRSEEWHFNKRQEINKKIKELFG